MKTYQVKLNHDLHVKRAKKGDTITVTEEEYQAWKSIFVSKKEEKVKPKVKVKKKDDGKQSVISLEKASKLYKEKFEKKVPNNKKNDVNWIINKLNS